MPDVDYHGWTHRPKSQGGTDPIPFPTIKWATASKGATTVAYSGGYYTPKFRFLGTNDTAAFELAGVSGDTAQWLQLNEPGYYQAWSYISTFSGAWSTDSFSLQTGVLDGSAFTLLSAESSLADFNLEFSRADEKLASSDDPNVTLFQFNAFHWNPGDDDMGFLDPLKMGVRILAGADVGSLSLVVYLHVVKLAGAGYTLIDADDL